MGKNYFDPNEFASLGSDSKMIQAAVDEAEKSGANRVVIPAYNERTGSFLWVIDKTILLPSHFTLEIDNAHLRMADGVFQQMISNRNAMTEIGKTPEGEQEDIAIVGHGRALLDGGVHNGLREGTAGKDGFPGVMNNFTIYLHNVHHFKVTGLNIQDQRYWALCFLYCWDGVISDLHFSLTSWSLRKDPNRPWKNQDGVDLRLGCHDIAISDLYGETLDDMVALTALAVTDRAFENIWGCKHLSPDIYNVTISNITAFNNHCKLVRLLCHKHHQIYNVDIHDIVDSTPDENGLDPLQYKHIRTSCCVEIGENDYDKGDITNRCQHGEMRDICISNVFSSSLAAVALNCSAKNVVVRNVFVKNPGGHALAVSQIKAGAHQNLDTPTNISRMENILVDGVSFHSEREGAVPFFFNGMIAKNFRVRNVSYRCANGLVRTNREQAESEEVIFENIVREE